jgi:hypothetical protein
VALLSCWLAPTLAVTVTPVDFDRLVAQAEFILTGKVLSTRCEWTGRGNERCIVTLVGFEVEAAHKGTPPARLELRFLGGTVGGTTLEVHGVPRFTTGERAILFVERNGEQFCPLVGIHHGTLGIQRDAATGQEILLRYNRSPLTDVREIGVEDAPAARASIAGKPDARPLSVAEFVEQIRRKLAGAGAR